MLCLDLFWTIRLLPFADMEDAPLQRPQRNPWLCVLATHNATISFALCNTFFQAFGEFSIWSLVLRYRDRMYVDIKLSANLVLTL